MDNLLQVILLGIIEGITEFLPISSTGHLLIAEHWVGACQILAGVFSGTSCFAATIFAAMLAGTMVRPVATEFAFLVGIRTVFAATAYEMYDVLKTEGAGSVDWQSLGVGFVVSAVVAFVAVKWLLKYIETHRFTIFAWYRIIVGVALLVVLSWQSDRLGQYRP